MMRILIFNLHFIISRQSELYKWLYKSINKRAKTEKFVKITANFFKFKMNLKPIIML